jgi:hypothetical protein
MFLAEYDRYGDIAENGPPSPYNEPPPEGFVKDYTPRPMPPLNAADVKKN